MRAREPVDKLTFRGENAHAVMIPLLAFATLGLLGHGRLYAYGDGTPDRPHDLVRACLKSQAVVELVSMRVETNELIDRLARPANGLPCRQKAELWIRRDGDRIDISGSHIFLELLPDLSWTGRSVVNSKEWITASRKVEQKAYKGGVYSANLKEGLRQALCALEHGGFLDGYFELFPQRRLMEFLQEAHDLHASREETVDGTPCKVVEGTTPYGVITAWLAPSKGHLPLKLLYKKGPNDLLGPGTPVTAGSINRPGEVIQTQGVTGLLDGVEVKPLNGAYVCVAGRFVQTQRLTRGPDCVSEYATRRKDIDLHPNFEGTDAFESPLAPGAVMTNNEDPNSGIIYRWTGKRLAPEYDDFSGTAQGSWRSRQRFIVVLWGLGGMLLLGLAAWFWRKRKYAKET